MVVPKLTQSKLKQRLAIALFFIVALGQAQVRFGIKAGLNLSTLKVSGESVSSSTLTGFHVGAFEDVKINAKFVLTPELLYSSQGAARKFDPMPYPDQPESGTTYQTRINYLNLDLMIKYYVIKKLDLEAGPQIGMLLAASNKIQGSKYDLSTVQPIDYGVNVGAGFDLTNHFSVGVRYYFGLFNISKYSHDEDVRNRVFGVSGAWRF